MPNGSKTPEKGDGENHVEPKADTSETKVAEKDTETNTGIDLNTTTETAGGGPSTPQGQKECIHLRAGHCKHGRMGRAKDEEGNTCPFLHPKKICQSYVRVGKCNTKECKNFHPFLCRSWKAGRECWLQDCKRLHPQEPSERKTNRQQRTNTAPRFAQNFKNRFPPPQKTDSHWPSNSAVNQQQQSEPAQRRDNQALFLDLENKIMGQVSNLFAQMMANQQSLQQQYQQQPIRQPMQQPMQHPMQYQTQATAQQQFNLPRGQGPDQWVKI